MKIALVHYSTPPVVGGVEQIMGAHAALFTARGHEVLRVSFRGEAEVLLDVNRSAAALRERLKPALSGADLVIAHNVMTMPFHLGLTEALTQLATEMPSTRWISWIHDVAAVNPDLAPVDALLRNATLGFEFVAVSAARATQFEEVTGVRPRIIPNGIDPARVLGLNASVAAFADQMQLFGRGPILLHPTRLLRRKNVELGLEVMSHLRGTGAALLITAAADPHNAASQDYANWIRAEHARLQLEDQVIFVADHLEVGEAELAGLYRLADALFLPSRQEGFGLPVLEAALHRMPAFLSDLRVFGEFAPATAKRFSLEMSPSEIASLISDSLAGDVAAMARKRSLEYRWEGIYDRYLAPLLSGK